MNEKFLELPEEKRLRIINAAFEVFAENEYKRASTDDIAMKAGISKGLLFYYFHNKKALYLYLFEYAVEIAKEKVIDQHFNEITDFFELCEYSAAKKTVLLERMPYIYDFMLRAYYSKGEDVSDEINKKMEKFSGDTFQTYLSALDYSIFKPEIDPMEIFGMLTWMTDGFIHACQRARQAVTAEEVMDKFRSWIAMFRKMSYKEEYQK